MNTPLSETFAACTGRFSAEMEHAWLLNDQRADEFEHRRAQFLTLMQAVTFEIEPREVLHLRINAKFAHAHLLSTASFSDDPVRAIWAKRRATAELDYCASLLLDS